MARSPAKTTDRISDNMTYQLLQGSVLDVLPTLPDNSVHCCVTSPPYWGLRDYGVPGQLGMEATPAEYVANLVAVFREVKRVLRPDGCMFLNLGDSYASGGLRGRGYGNGDSTKEYKRCPECKPAEEVAHA